MQLLAFRSSNHSNSGQCVSLIIPYNGSDSNYHCKSYCLCTNGWHYTYKLEAAVNHLVIQGGSELYTFVLEKEGYPSQKMQFTAKESAMQPQKKILSCLKYHGDTIPGHLFFNPDPETGKDAMISNLEPDKNFGDYKYFEATFLSESVLTVMRSNRSLICFNLILFQNQQLYKR